jgi:ABC-type transport system substrate-binding protein
MEGLAVKMSQPVPDGMFGASPRIPPAPYNVERARALMAEAGFKDGFQAELSCPNDRFPNDAKICEAVAQQYSRIGLKITVAAYPSSVFFSRRAKREFGLTMAGWGSLTGEASYFFGAVIHTADKEKNLGSIAELTRLPSALFIVDIVKEHIAVAEARKLNIPTFAMVDTNSDPSLVDFAIPANDDATKSIELIVDVMIQAINEGMEERKNDKTAVDEVSEEGAEEAGESVEAADEAAAPAEN